MKLKILKPAQSFLITAVSILGIYGCSSTSSSSSQHSAGTAEAERPSTSAQARAEAAEEREAPMTQGDMVNITSSLNNEPVFDGSLPAAVLSESLAALDELSRKEPDNIGVTITYLGLLRLYGRSPDTYNNVQRRGGAKGAKNPWFLLEAGYGALKRKDYGMADFLFAKAEKFENFPNVKNAVAHAQGVRAMLMGKTQTGIALMRKSAEASPAFLPSLLTLGFLGLKSGDAPGAERMFRAAVALQPNSFNAKLGLAAAMRARGKALEALPVIAPLYKTLSQDRRVAWNYALVLADIPDKNKEALEVLGRYFQMPNPIPEIDNKANILITKLQRPAAPAPAQPAAQASPSQDKTGGGNGE